MGARGEGTISANGTEVHVLFTNRALATAQQSLGRGIVAVAQGFSDGSSGIIEVATLLQVGMEAARRDSRAGGRPVRLDDAYDVMDEVGFAGVASVVMEAVAAVLGYSGDGLHEDEDADPN
jgi:hypothetical protein